MATRTTVSRMCSVAKCTTVIDERALNAGGIMYLFDRWANAFVAGTTTKCQAHYHDTDAPAAYAAYIGSPILRNRERG